MYRFILASSATKTEGKWSDCGNSVVKTLGVVVVNPFFRFQPFELSKNN